jgi:hypothetical protein
LFVFAIFAFNALIITNSLWQQWPSQSNIALVKIRHPNIMERLLDKAASLGNSDLDGLRADCRGSDNLAAGDRDDLAGVAAR